MGTRIILFTFHQIFLPVLLKFILGVRYTGKEEVKAMEGRPLFIVANHNSHVDTAGLLAALSWKQYLNTTVVAAADYFGNKGFKSRLVALLFRTLFIPRKRPKNLTDPDPIKMVQDEIRKGRNVVFFPEGSRGEPEELAPFKSGVGYILKDFPDQPVLPAYAEGLGHIFPKGSMWILPHKARIHFGKAFTCKATEPREIKAEIEGIVKNLMGKVVDMRPENNDGGAKIARLN